MSSFTGSLVRATGREPGGIFTTYSDLGAFTGPVVRALANAGVIVNVTAITTEQQVERVAECLAPNVAAIVSVFAGRVADTGRDPVPLMRACLRALANLATGQRSQTFAKRA